MHPGPFDRLASTGSAQAGQVLWMTAGSIVLGYGPACHSERSEESPVSTGRGAYGLCRRTFARTLPPHAGRQECPPHPHTGFLRSTVCVDTWPTGFANGFCKACHSERSRNKSGFCAAFVGGQNARRIGIIPCRSRSFVGPGGSSGGQREASCLTIGERVILSDAEDCISTRGH